MFPQQVGTGNPNTGVENPSGIGAGVVCSLPSFAANDCLELLLFSEEESGGSVAAVVKFKKSVTRNEAPGVLASRPCA